MRRLHARRPLFFAAVVLAAGLLLRLFFVRRYAFTAGDSLLYQDIALNWLQAHVYGLSTEAAPRPTLIRLPGYPALLAALAAVFGSLLQAPPGSAKSFWPVLYFQVLADLGTCVLVSLTAARIFGRRAAEACLIFGALCPFLANYCAVPLTETMTCLTIAAAYWSVERYLHTHRLGVFVVLCVTLSFSILLRPDQGLLTLAILPLLWTARRRPIAIAAPHGPAEPNGANLPSGQTYPRRAVPVFAAALLIALPLIPWTVRNYRTFHVVQPLAPRLANDPGEAVPLGFQAWFRTFAVDFSSTEDAYWKYPEEPVDPRDLPARAFDSPIQQAETSNLLHEAAAFNGFRPEIDARFAVLARERARSHPLRTYVVLPAARLANMLLHPRTEMLSIDERWWRYSLHPAQTLFAGGYALLNLIYFSLGMWGFIRARRSEDALTRQLAWSLAAFVLLRCGLLLTLDNAEQRYTMELLPIAILLSGALWSTSAATEAAAGS